jgi:DNA-binding NarL/FixJ family response regulator
VPTQAAVDARGREGALKALMSDASQIADSQITVAIVGGRRFREQCLASFLEANGVGIEICPMENLRNHLRGPETAADLTIIDTGQHTCSDPEIRTIFERLRNVMPSAPIVVVSDREDWTAVVDAMDAGARAYFPSSLDPEILFQTLRLVEKGGTFIPLKLLSNVSVYRKRQQRVAVRRSEIHGLTLREEGVLKLLKTGLSNKGIARELNIEEGTVKVHVRRIMRKLNVANRTQAALLADRMPDA